MSPKKKAHKRRQHSGHPSMRALEIAVFLVGREQASTVKALWDARSGFYPKPVSKGRNGAPHLYDPREVIAAAARYGYVAAGEIETAFRVLERVAATLVAQKKRQS